VLQQEPVPVSVGLPLVLLQESRQQLQQPLAWQQPHEFYPEVNRPLPEQQGLLQASHQQREFYPVQTHHQRRRPELLP